MDRGGDWVAGGCRHLPRGLRGSARSWWGAHCTALGCQGVDDGKLALAEDRCLWILSSLLGAGGGVDLFQ